MEDSQFNVLDTSVLFEDDDIVVINKPPGWVVNNSQTYHGQTVQSWMQQKVGTVKLKVRDASEAYEYGTPEEIYTQRSGIVHRLDKDTSGVLLLAKTPDALYDLLGQFRERDVEKMYLALVHGKLIPQSGTIRLPMERSVNDHKKFAVSVDGRMSETEYKLVEFYPGLPTGIAQKKGKSYQGFSLVDLTPKTGRTHQIRVHMAAIKHPLVGDGVYGGRKRKALDQEWCPRQFLHAKQLCFTHPTTKEKVCFEAPLPNDLQEVIEKLTHS